MISHEKDIFTTNQELVYGIIPQMDFRSAKADSFIPMSVFNIIPRITAFPFNSTLQKLCLFKLTTVVRQAEVCTLFTLICLSFPRQIKPSRHFSSDRQLLFAAIHLSDLSLQAHRDPPRLGGEDEARG